MKKLLLLGTFLIGCGDGDTVTGAECGVGTTLSGGECVADAVCGAGTILMDGMCIPDGTPPTPVFRQIEHLARPGINEVFLFTDGFMEGYNATAPSFTGVPQATLDMVVAEAKTVMKALYLGVCLLNGALGLTPDGGTGLKPALVECDEVSNVGATTGTNMFTDGDALTGKTLTAVTAARAQVYADKLFAQFVPDVMRIDTARASGYLNGGGISLNSVCGDPTAALPLLCGGRNLNDDVIDVTYNYILGGLAGTPGAEVDLTLGGQVRALVSDGVSFDNTANAGAGDNKEGLTNGVATNKAQGHPAITAAFPYSAAPF